MVHTRNVNNSYRDMGILIGEYNYVDFQEKSYNFKFFFFFFLIFISFFSLRVAKTRATCCLLAVADNCEELCIHQELLLDHRFAVVKKQQQSIAFNSLVVVIL